MFVPKGYTPLTRAIDCLARAHRTASPNPNPNPNPNAAPPLAQKKNLETTKTAQERLRAELHSGTIRAAVMWPVSGRMFEIIPDNWARDVGPTWIDEGVLLMRSDSGMQLVGVSLGRVWYEYRVQIFVRNDDLRHLIEHPSEITSIANNAELGVREIVRGGRPREYDFDSARELVRTTVQQTGLPSRTNRRLPALDSWWNCTGPHGEKDQQPSQSLVRQRVNEWLEEISKNPQK